MAGTVVTYSVSGFLAASSWGWKSIFYLSGVFGALWCIPWFFLVANSPKEHRWISKAEFTYIDSSINAEHSIRNHETKGTCGEIPWLSMAKSLPLWAICVSHFCHNWGFYTLLAFLPTYLRTILGYNIKANGLLSALPYLLGVFSRWFTSVWVDYVRKKRWLSTTVVRKICDFSAQSVHGLCLLLVTFMGCNRDAIIILLNVGTVIAEFSGSSYMVNHLDIGPIYAGVLFGISNCLANIPGFITPAVVGAITENNQTISAWSKVFYITTGINWFAALFYLLFASGKVQPWAKEREYRNEEKENEEL